MDQNTEVNLDQLNDEADIAADYLEELLDIVDYEGDIELGGPFMVVEKVATKK